MTDSKPVRRFTSAIMTLSVITLCALCIVGCSSSSPEEPEQGAQAATEDMATVTDMLGRDVEVPADVDRIVGIGSSSLRLISYLQAADEVVGVEKGEIEDSVTCCYRHVYYDTFKDLPVIGEGGAKGVTPNEEAIMEVAPQVVFASIDQDAADALQEKTGIPVICLTLSNTVFDQTFYDNVELVGGILGKDDRADEIVQYMKDTQKDLQERTTDIPAADIKTAYAAGISYRGGHGFAGTEANFPPFAETNVKNIADVDGANGAFDIDLEEVSSAQPDFIFVESGNLSLVEEDYASNSDYFASLNAVQNGNVYSLIAYRYYATNTELALANCYQVGATVYPDRFEGIDPTEKLDEITEFFLGKNLSDDLAQEGCSFRQIDLAAE